MNPYLSHNPNALAGDFSCSGARTSDAAAHLLLNQLFDGSIVIESAQLLWCSSNSSRIGTTTMVQE